MSKAGGKGRRGGRSAKLRRDAAAKGHSRAVHPGLSGGAYKPLSDADIHRIYDTALTILETIGIGDPIPEILAYALPKGAVLNEHNRLCFPRALVALSSVEDTLRNTQRDFYALRLTGDAQVECCGLKTAEEDGTLSAVGSTYSPDNDVVYDGISRPGIRIVSFAPILCR